MVKPKKHLGQHFLTDLSIAEKIASALTLHQDYNRVLEIGPGMGVLTQFLLQDPRFETFVVEIDRESVAYLHAHFPRLRGKILSADFLKMDLQAVPGSSFAVIGNFPYNISSQILFRVFENRNLVPELVGMFQHEVAQRIASGPGSKDYGILSVLLQAFYDIEYLFSVEPGVFNPPPKVRSGVIRLRRNSKTELPVPAAFFKTVVKTAFNQRRKTLRNSLKSLIGNQPLEAELLSRRPETLSPMEFIDLATALHKDSK